MTTFYVAKTGSDSTGTGTFANPWLTISHALPLMSGGDTLLILVGTYSENIYNPPSGPDDAHHTIIMPYSGALVTINPSSGSKGALIALDHDHSNITFDGLVVDGINAGAIDGITVCDNAHPGSSCQNITIQNCTVKNGLGGGTGGGGITARTNDSTHPGNCKILNNTIIDWAATQLPNSLDHGIYAAFQDSLIEYNVIHGCASHGIHQFSSHNGCDNNIIRNNRVYNNGTVGIGLYSGTGTKAYNNLVYGTHNYAGIRSAFSGNSNSIFNNTVYNISGFGIRIESGISGMFVQNNITYLNSGAGFSDLGTGTTADHNLPPATNPSFVSAGTGDFHLQAGSPAINAGTTLAAVTTDFDGITRPQGASYDMGAFEFPTTAPQVNDTKQVSDLEFSDIEMRVSKHINDLEFLDGEMRIASQMSLLEYHPAALEAVRVSMQVSILEYHIDDSGGDGGGDGGGITGDSDICTQIQNNPSEG